MVVIETIVDYGYENHAEVVGAINVLERGYRLLARGETVQSNGSMKQEPTEVTQAVIDCGRGGCQRGVLTLF